MAVCSLPAELVDYTIDFLHSDKTSLGACGLVNHAWLSRTRYHLFSRLQLTSSRLTAFSQLLRSQRCTFRSTVQTLRFDNSEYWNHLHALSEDSTTALSSPNRCSAIEDQHFLSDAAALVSSFSNVETLQFGCIDWTSIPPPSQNAIVRRLARLSRIHRIDFEGTVFHDLRDLLRIISVFPSLEELGVKVGFSKLRTEAVRGALNLCMPKGLRVIDIGTEDGTAVVLSCLASKTEKRGTIGGTNEDRGEHNTRGLESLRLHHITFNELGYVQNALHTLGPGLRHLVLGFSSAPKPLKGCGSAEQFKTLDCSHPNQVNTSTPGTLQIENIRLIHPSNTTPHPHAPTQPSITYNLVPVYLSELSSPHIESIEIHLKSHPAPSGSAQSSPAVPASSNYEDFESLNWSHLERTLVEDGRFPKLQNVTIVIITSASPNTQGNRENDDTCTAGKPAIQVNHNMLTNITQNIQNSMHRLVSSKMLRVLRRSEFLYV
ncbi:hypothetical protein AX16_005306 [Volvariella volvacea WC 439]|nr:hypothetical protein AX16_005306 [Volvariella volvacea WC 439]